MTSAEATDALRSVISEPLAAYRNEWSADPQAVAVPPEWYFPAKELFSGSGVEVKRLNRRVEDPILGVLIGAWSVYLFSVPECS